MQERIYETWERIYVSSLQREILFLIEEEGDCMAELVWGIIKADGKVTAKGTICYFQKLNVDHVHVEINSEEIKALLTNIFVE